jgi:pyrroloquinoline-quinone synthase
MTNVTGWWSDVEAIIQERSLLKHPFYQAWQKGELTSEDLRDYAKQYYPHVAAFPRYVSAVHSNTEDAAARAVLLDNLIEEERGEGGHPSLWLNFAEAVGNRRDDVTSAAPTAKTADCVSTFTALSRHHNPLAGLAALYAYESQIPAIAATKRLGLDSFYGLRGDDAHSFFRVHQSADVWHSQVERETIQRLAVTESDRVLVKTSVKSACDAVWSLLDGVMESRGLCAAC